MITWLKKFYESRRNFYALLIAMAIFIAIIFWLVAPYVEMAVQLKMGG